ncbi:MAG: hemerythrin family protein [Planctomycetes bacterium]|nr:hemerythrin family protein [Planctomycetota bacterium]
MAFITWNDGLSVNVKEIDAHHKKLIGLINQLHDSMLEGKGKEASGKILSALVDYTASHFTYEEKLFKQYGYPEYDAHRKDHEDLIRQVKDFKSQFDKGTLGLTLKLMTFLKDWLNNHILGTDKKYVVFLNSKGVA